MRSVLTIATGKQVYIDMAINLARSFSHWHTDSDILFYLATDQPEAIPADVRRRIQLIDIRHLKQMTGFSIKLYIDQLIQTPYTLFIDADCLIYGRLEAVFDRFKGHAVSAIGDVQIDGEFFCNVSQIIQQLAIAYLPRFVGGIYYLEKNDTCRRVFELARRLLPEYDSLGLVRLRGKENEEPLLAISMAIYGLRPIMEDGSIKADRMFFHHCSTDVLQGKARLWNTHEVFPAVAYYPIRESLPVVVHYNNDFSENFDYKSDSIRLYLSNARQWPESVIESWVKYRYRLPGVAGKELKNFFRPFYRKVFGIRKIKPIKRAEEVNC